MAGLSGRVLLSGWCSGERVMLGRIERGIGWCCPGLAGMNGQIRSQGCLTGGRRGRNHRDRRRSILPGRDLRCRWQANFWLQVGHLLVHRIKMVHDRAVYHGVVFYRRCSADRCLELLFGIAPLLPPEQVATRQQPNQGQQNGDQPPPAPLAIRIHPLRQFGPVSFRIGCSGDLFKLVFEYFIKVIVLHKHLLFGVL